MRVVDRESTVLLLLTVVIALKVDSRKQQWLVAMKGVASVTGWFSCSNLYKMTGSEKTQMKVDVAKIQITKAGKAACLEALGSQPKCLIAATHIEHP